MLLVEPTDQLGKMGLRFNLGNSLLLGVCSGLEETSALWKARVDGVLQNSI